MQLKRGLGRHHWNDYYAPKNNQQRRKRKPPTRNYSNPEPLNTSHIGKPVIITLSNGGIESGEISQKDLIEEKKKLGKFAILSNM